MNQLSFFSPSTNSETESETSTPAENKIEEKELAPMLQQYVTLKKQYPEYLLLFQVGDFYEIFFDDAPIVAQALNIRLTSRDKEQANAAQMCGIPIHALDNYLPKLLQQGHSCIIVGQVEESKNKKGMVKREIIRMVTPGVRFDGDGLDEKKFNYLCAVSLSGRGSGAICYIDVSTGWLRLQELENEDDLFEALLRISPSEIVLPSVFNGVSADKSERWYRGVKRIATELSAKISYRPFNTENYENLAKRVSKLLCDTAENVAEQQKQKMSKLSLESLQTLQANLDYVEEVSFTNLPRLAQFDIEDQTKAVVIDTATRRNLELTETRIDGDKKNSLLSHIDYCKTAMGARLLAEWILTPSINLEQITKRQDLIEELLANSELVSELRQQLSAVRDIDRLCSRITSNRAVPRDLANLRDSLLVFPKIKEIIFSLKSTLALELQEHFDALEDIYSYLQASLIAEPPFRLNEGDIVKDGYNAEVDRLRKINNEGSDWLVNLEARERAATGITGLKIKYNNVFGYFLEVSKVNLSKVPAHYERRQTLANAERFIIPELKEFEMGLLSAKAKLYELEKSLFLEIRRYVADLAYRVQRSAKYLAELDVFCCFSHLADKHNFHRPKFIEGSLVKIESGRHPVVESVIGANNFIANDTLLTPEKRRFAILTGPNMGGKSTYLRQVGIIQLLAQTGSFVPAKNLELGVVDRIFTRIGAADDLARGDSTFMVEMREAATIVKKATARSLVLIDEIGRGTATQDGLAIATAIAEYLHDQVKCLTIFATHFHELTELPKYKDSAFCLAVGIVEDGEEIIFTHRIEEKAALRSYGIEVARLAG
nr:DNA mismatch repair protein MutS [Pseudomonadota bacterium]